MYTELMTGLRLKGAHDASGAAAHRLAPIPDGDLLSVPGLRGSAVATGVKPSGGLDLALVTADRPWTAAGVFTRNAAAAAPVLLSRARLAEQPAARAVVINSGNANALTGERGARDALAMVERAEARCGGGPALVLSTGVIGEPLPIEAVLEGIDRAGAGVGPDAGGALARAIMTTDTRPKTRALSLDMDGRRFTVGGMAKGSGMIHPNMATMLAVIATDAPLSAPHADAVLRRAVDRSFHEISVDGETSTNDAVLLLCAPSESPLAEGSPEADLVEAVIERVARSLAEQIVFDGEGASRVLEVRVDGARDHSEARRVADAICRSSLVKTALAGADPNWGRMLSAAGACGVPLDPDAVELRIEGHCVFSDGHARAVSEEALRASFGGRRVRVSLDLSRGEATARMLTTDLTERYVQINSHYTT